MGCGFSTEDTKASDEEAILKSSDGLTGKTEQTTAQTRMGGALAKKSPAKKRRGDSKGKGKEQGDFLTSLTFIFVFFARGDCVSDAQARRHNLQILSYVHT
jgi:hypothetical protein